MSQLRAPGTSLLLLLVMGACGAKVDDNEMSNEDAVMEEAPDAGASTVDESDAGPSTSVRLSGFYSFGFEASGFQSCQTTNDWWWTEFSGKALSVYQEHVHYAECNPGCAYYVDGIADITGPGEYGHEGAYSRDVTFTSLNNMIKVSGLAAPSRAYCPEPDLLTILGRIVDAQGADTSAAVNVMVVTFEEWNGEIPNDAAPEFETKSADGYFSIRVPPGRWGVLGMAGTCSSAPPKEAVGNAGDVVSVELSLTCNE